MSETKEITPIDQVKRTILSMAPQFKAALPSHISHEKFTRVALTAITQNPDLLKADRHSLYGACLRLAQDGLLPDGREAVITVFNTNMGTKEKPEWIKKAQAMPMTAGILKKVRNSGELSSITVQIIHRDDNFSYWVDEHGEHIMHKPDFFTKNRGEPIGVYSLAKLRDGAISIEVMTKEEVEKVQASSKSPNAGPWKNWPDEMWKKTVIKRHAKRLPSSSDLDNVIHADDEDHEAPPPAVTEVSVVDREVIEATPTPPKSKTKPNKLGEIIESQAQPPAPVKNYAPSSNPENEVPL